MKTSILFILSSLLLLFACGKSTEVFVVNDSSNILPDEKAAANQPKPILTQQDDFSKIVIGESGDIKTLDPLFASSSSELRAVSLIYDGLTSLNSSGKIVPAIAKKWNITRDSLTYTFTLNENAFFHDDNRFTSGNGRAVSTNDVINAFKRMAEIHIPDKAASMFMNIDGFKPFYLEQTDIKIPSARVINNIKGIVVRNDSTLEFRLMNPDANFLNKLAHPLASIYPPESLSPNKLPISKPIGSGAFYVAQQSKNLLILAAFEDALDSPNSPNRVDIIFGKKEPELYQAFTKGDIDALVEISPASFKQVTDSTGRLDFIFSEVFRLDHQNVVHPISLNYNPASNNNPLFNFLTSQQALLPTFNSRFGNISYPQKNTIKSTLSNQTVYISYTEHPTELFLINAIADVLSAENSTIVLSSSYAVSENINLSTRDFSGAQHLLTWEYPVQILSHKSVSGISINYSYWNISFNGAKSEQD